MSALLLIKLASDDDNSTAEIAAGVGLAGAGAGAGYYGHRTKKKADSLRDRLADNSRASTIRKGKNTLEYKWAKNAAHSEHSFIGRIMNKINSLMGAGNNVDTKKYKELNAKILRKGNAEKDKIIKAINSGELDQLSDNVKNKGKTIYRLARKGKYIRGAGAAAGIAGLGLAGYGAYRKAQDS